MGQIESVEARSPLLIGAASAVTTRQSASSGGVEMQDAEAFTPELSGPNLAPGAEVELEGISTEAGDSADVVGAAGRPRSDSSAMEELPPCPRATGGRLYLVYCLVCLLVTGLLLATTLFKGFGPDTEVKISRRTLRIEEEVIDACLGLALFTETIVALYAMGARRFCRSPLRIFDAVVAGLTLACGAFFVLRRLRRTVADIAEDVDIPMLALRFTLQPCRMVSTATMVVRAHKRLHRAPLELDSFIFDPRMDEGHRALSVLTPEVASAIREQLPVRLQFVDWHLVYSTAVNGISLLTFYRMQTGPNIIVIRDNSGGVFGAFAPEPWAIQRGCYGQANAFLWRLHSGPAGSAAPTTAVGCSDTVCIPPAERTPLQEDIKAKCENKTRVNLYLELFRFQPTALIRRCMWSDEQMLGFGEALVIMNDFHAGSSNPCKFFHNPRSLSSSGMEFEIRDFECWSLEMRTEE